MPINIQIHLSLGVIEEKNRIALSYQGMRLVVGVFYLVAVEYSMNLS
jgi:hypothetical protein